MSKPFRICAVAFGEGRHDHLVSLARAADEGIGVEARVYLDDVEQAAAHILFEAGTSLMRVSASGATAASATGAVAGCSRRGTVMTQLSAAGGGVAGALGWRRSAR